MRDYPFSFEDLDPQLEQHLIKEYAGHYYKLIKVNPGGTRMLADFPKVAVDMYNFEIRPEDVWVVGIPKSGTTWTQEAVYCMLHDADLSPENKDNVYSSILCPEAEMFKDWWQGILQPQLKSGKVLNPMGESVHKVDLMEQANCAPDPRLFKSHMPLSLLNPKLLDIAKVVYVTRNPKDVCVSSYYHLNNAYPQLEPISFATFVKVFCSHEFYFQPYWEHVRLAWEKRDHPNLLFIKYEDMIQDLYGTLHKIAHFLGKKLNAKQMRELANHLTIKNMRELPTTNFQIMKDAGLFKESEDFIRKGIIGDWKNHFTPELNAMMDEWIRKNRGNCGIEFSGFEMAKL